jgi:hypothetical protein
MGGKNEANTDQTQGPQSFREIERERGRGEKREASRLQQPKCIRFFLAPNERQSNASVPSPRSRDPEILSVLKSEQSCAKKGDDITLFQAEFQVHSKIDNININMEEFEAGSSDIVGCLFVKHRDCISHGGYAKGLLVSALQKYIRRGETTKAVWCALELLKFGKLNEPEVLQEYLARHPDRDPNGGGNTKKPPHPRSIVQGILTNLANRLRVISVEDVGIGQPGLAGIVSSLLSEWESSDRTASGKIVMAVNALSLAPKLRLLSDLKSVYHLPPLYGHGDPEEKRIKGFIGQLREFYEIAGETGEETMHTNNMGVFYWYVPVYAQCPGLIGVCVHRT